MNVSRYDDDIEDIRCDGNINLRQKLSSDLMKILLDDSFNDVCIKLHDGEVLANKVVLSARSEYFAASLRWKENNKEQNDSSRHEIIFEHCSTKIMTVVIAYLYSGVLKVSDLTIMEVFELREQVRILLPGDKINKIIEELIQDERFEELNIIELLELREQLRTLLPEEEIWLKEYVERGPLDQNIEEEDDKFTRVERSFFLTNEEVITLIKSDQVQNKQRIDMICEFFRNELQRIDTSRGQAMLASLVFHGALKSVEELYMNAKSISRIPGEHFKKLLSSTDLLGIIDEGEEIKTSVREAIFLNVRSKRIELIYLDLTTSETALLVTYTMMSGVEEITLAAVDLDVKTFLSYQGNGKCKQIDIFHYGFYKDHKKELLAWCKQNKWTMKRNIEGSDRVSQDFEHGIRLERNSK